jgi:hypothetical protein
VAGFAPFAFFAMITGDDVRLHHEDVREGSPSLTGSSKMVRGTGCHELNGGTGWLAF